MKNYIKANYKVGDPINIVDDCNEEITGHISDIWEDCIHIKHLDGETFTMIDFDGIVSVGDNPRCNNVPSITRNDILDKAKSIINGERQGTYGKAEDSFAVIAQLWTAYLGKDLSSADVANMMVLMKVARNRSGVYKDDNWIDMCGYAALGGEIQAKYDDKKGEN